MQPGLSLRVPFTFQGKEQNHSIPPNRKLSSHCVKIDLIRRLARKHENEMLKAVPC